MVLAHKETTDSYNGDIAKPWTKQKVPSHNEKTSLWKSYRLRVVIFTCIIMCSSFASQASMTSAIVCMKNDNANNNNNTQQRWDTNETFLNYDNNTTTQKNNNKYQSEWDLSWDAETQGWVVSAFFVGYYVMQLPSGVIVTRLGPRSSLVAGLLATGILHLASIPAARWNMPLLYVIRTFAGLACGPMLPGVYALVANWCPAQESSFLFGIAGVGIELGNTLSFILSLFGCESGIQGGWPIVFYALGGFMVLLAITMMLFITDFPVNNKLIDPREAQYIRDNRAHGEKARQIPYGRILVSRQVWAFLIAQLAIEWMYYTLVTQGPRYLRDVIKLSPWQTNLLSSLPFLAIIPFFLVVGYGCDKIIQYKIASRTTVRKFNELYATILTGTPLVFLGFLPEGEWGQAFVIYAVAAMGITGTYAGYMANPGDLSPAHAGFLASLGQSLTMWVAFAIPAFTGYLTKQKDRESWQTVFYIVIGLELFACTVYMIFGSGQLQPWAVDEVTEETPIIRREFKENNK